MSVYTWEIKSWLFFKSRNYKACVFELLYITNLHAQKCHFLVLIYLFKLFIFVKETGGGGEYVFQFNAPQIFKLVDNCSLFIQSFHNFLTCHIIETKNTVTNSGRFDKFDPTNFRCVISMSPAASFNINPFNVDNSDCITRDDTSLIQCKSELLLGLLFVLEVFSDFVAFQNYSIGFILNLHFYLLWDWWIVSNIQVSIVLSFLRTVLPNVWA